MWPKQDVIVAYIVYYSFFIFKSTIYYVRLKGRLVRNRPANKPVMLKVCNVKLSFDI